MSESIELSTGEPWRGLKPGMARAEAVRVLEAAGAQIQDDETDPGWVLANGEEWGMEMRFAEDGAQPLRQLVLDDWECVWTGQAIANQPLHTALAVLGVAASGAGWRAEDAVQEPFEDLKAPGPEPVADEDLLRDGSLWLPQRGLGLVMCDGAVNEIVWRRAEDVPRDFLGPVTEAQRQLSARPDLAAHLRNHWLAQRVSARRSINNPAQKLLTLLLVVALGFIGWRGWHETQRWQQARMLTGQLVSIEKATRKPWIDRCVIRYKDPTGRVQTATIGRNEFYVPPRETGEETQIAYLAGDPPQVKGSAHARDAAFLQVVPWAIGTVAGYMVLWSLAGFVGRLLRKPAPPASSSGPTPPPPFVPDRGR